KLALRDSPTRARCAGSFGSEDRNVAPKFTSTPKSAKLFRLKTFTKSARNSRFVGSSSLKLRVRERSVLFAPQSRSLLRVRGLVPYQYISSANRPASAPAPGPN